MLRRVCVDADGRLAWERLIGTDGEERRGRAVAVLEDESVVAAYDGLQRGRAALGSSLRVRLDEVTHKRRRLRCHH